MNARWVKIIFHTACDEKRHMVTRLYSKGGFLCCELADERDDEGNPIIIAYPIANIFSVARAHLPHAGAEERGGEGLMSNRTCGTCGNDGCHGRWMDEGDCDRWILANAEKIIAAERQRGDEGMMKLRQAFEDAETGRLNARHDLAAEREAREKVEKEHRKTIDVMSGAYNSIARKTEKIENLETALNKAEQARDEVVRDRDSCLDRETAFLALAEKAEKERDAERENVKVLRVALNHAGRALAAVEGEDGDCSETTLAAVRDAITVVCNAVEGIIEGDFLAATEEKV